MYIESLTVDQFRCFEHAEMQFQYPGRRPPQGRKSPRLANVNLILGDNGTGKTTVLQAIALVVLGPVASSMGFRSRFSVRRLRDDSLGSKPLTPDESKSDRTVPLTITAKMQMHDQDRFPTRSEWQSQPTSIIEARTSVTRRQTTESIEGLWMGPGADVEGLFNDTAPAFFLAAYGANRRSERVETFNRSSRQRVRAPRYERVASLFEESVSLTPVERLVDVLLPADLPGNETGRNRTDRYFDLCETLNHLLYGNVELRSLTKSDAWFSVRGTLLPFPDLSDGYRGFVGWVCDLLYQMHTVLPKGRKVADLHGVVMVDELDLLLHPEWQRTVIDTLAAGFPKIQFFFTTHSPILTSAVEASNLLLTEANPETGAATVSQGQEKVHGLSADQILSGPYFGLTTSRPPEAVNQMRELAGRASNGDRNASVEFLKRLANGFEEENEAAEPSVPPRSRRAKQHP